MDVQETIKCLYILLDNVVLDEQDSKSTKINDVRPDSFDWVIREAIYYLESLND